MFKHGVGTPKKFDAYCVKRLFDANSLLVAAAAISIVQDQTGPGVETTPTEMDYRPVSKFHHSAYMRHLIRHTGLFSYEMVRDYNKKAREYWGEIEENSPKVAVILGKSMLTGGTSEGKRLIAVSLEGEGAQMLLQQRNGFMQAMNASFGGAGITNITSKFTEAYVPIGALNGDAALDITQQVDDMLLGRELTFKEPQSWSLSFRQSHS